MKKRQAMQTLTVLTILLLIVVTKNKSTQTSLVGSCNQQVKFDIKSNIVGLALKQRIPLNESFSQSTFPLTNRRKHAEWYLLRNIRHDCYHEFTFLRSDSNYAASIEASSLAGKNNGCQRGLEVFSLFYIEQADREFRVKSCLVLENAQEVMISEWNLQRAIPKSKGDTYLEKFLVVPDIVQEPGAFLGTSNEANESLSWVSHEKYADLYAYILTTTVFTITLCFWMFLTIRWLLGKLYNLKK